MYNDQLISIIMPVYNCDTYLSQSIDSVLYQTYKNWELIIIDDQSTDESKKIALSYAEKDSRIKVIENKYNKGIHGALNSGIDICRGDFIARTDGDDINYPNRLEIQLEFLNKNKDIDIVGTGYQLLGCKNNKRIFHPSNSIILTWKFISNTYFCHPSVLFRKKILSTMPQYPEVACEDFAFFSRIIQNHKGSNIKNILLLYRQHDSNYSNTARKKIDESIKNTYFKNYKFYTNEEKNADIFYDFQHNNKIDFKNIYTLNQINKKIAKNIQNTHNFKNIEYVNLRLNQTKDLIKITIISYIKKFLRK